jgi:hypothetical protein
MASTKKRNARAARNETTFLLVGTSKGAFIFRSSDGRRNWKISGPHFKGNKIYHLAYDGRNGTMLASVNHDQWGPSVARSTDEGKTWSLSKTPPKYPKNSDWSVKRVWHIEPGTEDEQDVLYAGVEPAGLFKSNDGGESWAPNLALLNHKTRAKWQPGAGGLCMHTILVDPRDSRKQHVGISAVGTLFTSDGGMSWKFQNKNVLADFNPEPHKYPEFGQCVHKLAWNATNPDVIFHQNHCGVYRSDDGGENWIDIRNNLPSRFGFPMAADVNDPKKAYNAPLESDGVRLAPDGHFAIWTTDNYGKEWEPLDRGLPKTSYFTVLRECLATDNEDPTGVYFGTTTGHLYASKNEGRVWTKISDALPPILSVSASSAE